MGVQVLSKAKCYGNLWQNLENLGLLKCDPYVKHLFLWLFIVRQHKPYKKVLNTGADPGGTQGPSPP